MKKMSALVMLAFFAFSFRGEIVFGQSQKENAQLANALTSAKISLEMGMMASEREGQARGALKPKSDSCARVERSAVENIFPSKAK